MDTNAAVDIFDAESMSLLGKLPRNDVNLHTSNPTAIWRLLSWPFILFGVIGLGQQIMPIIQGGAEYESLVEGENSGMWIAFTLLALALLGVGWFLRELSAPKPIALDDFSIGNLVDYMFVNLQTGDVENLKRTARTVIDKTDGSDKNDGKETLLAKAIATEVLAETHEADTSRKISLARSSIELFNELLENDIKTPLVYFMLATSHRILESDDAAVKAYQNYLALHPNDKDAEAIMNELQSKLNSGNS